MSKYTYTDSWRVAFLCDKRRGCKLVSFRCSCPKHRRRAYWFRYVFCPSVLVSVRNISLWTLYCSNHLKYEIDIWYTTLWLHAEILIHFRLALCSISTQNYVLSFQMKIWISNIKLCQCKISCHGKYAFGWITLFFFERPKKITAFSMENYILLTKIIVRF